MRLRFLNLGLMLIFLGSAAPAMRAQKSATAVPDRERERRSLAINFLHALNAAETSYKKNHGSYADWDALLGNGDFTQNGTKWSSDSFPTVAHALYGSGPEIVPGWKLRLKVSNDGKSYDASIEDATDPKCRYAAFTDERGAVRQGKSVDCEP
jgi:hypothetical protein